MNEPSNQNLLKRIYQPVLVFLAALVGFGTVLLRTHNILDDGGFYTKEAEILIGQLRAGQIPFIKNLTWLTATHLKDSFGGIHFLYPYTLAPFVYLLGPFRGAEIATAFFFAFALALFFYILQKLKIPYPLLWTVMMLLGSTDFIFRMMFVRPLAISVSLLLLSIYFMLRRKYLALTITALFFVWLYDGYILLFVPLGIIFCTDFINFGKINLKWFWPLLGVIAGLVINPYFPKNVVFLHFTTNPLFFGNIQKINEWLPYNYGVFFSSNLLIALILLAGVFWFCFKDLLNFKIFNNPEEYGNKIFLLLTTLAILVLTFSFRRFIDYLVPTTLLFSSFIFADTIKALNWQKLKNLAQSRPWIYGLPFIISLLIITCGFFTFSNYFTNLASAREISDYRAPLAKIASVSQPGDIVYNVYWDEFPQLIFWDSKNNYINGLDPAFIYSYSRADYWLNQHIANGDIGAVCAQEICDADNSVDTLDAIKNTFGAKYIFFKDSRNEALKNYLDEQIGKVVLIYSDNQFSVYKIL